MKAYDHLIEVFIFIKNGKKNFIELNENGRKSRNTIK